MYVGVTGTSDGRKKTIGAAAVYIRNDDGRKLSGLGVVDKVIPPTPRRYSAPTATASGLLTQPTSALLKI